MAAIVVSGKAGPTKMQAHGILDQIILMIYRKLYNSVVNVDLLSKHDLMGQARSSVITWFAFSIHQSKHRLKDEDEAKGETKSCSVLGERSFLCFAWLVFLNFFLNMSRVGVEENRENNTPYVFNFPESICGENLGG